MKRLAFVILLAIVPFAPAQTPIPPELGAYIAKPEPDYAWKLNDTAQTDAGTIYTLHLTSQKWQGVVWEHGFQVVVPKLSKPAATMVLWNQGGTPSPTNAALAMQIADRVGAPVAFLYGIPNQPLTGIGGTKKEDALIAETFIRYLDTKDASWPLLFPMAKSLIKAMDALQAFAKDELKTEVTGFVVTGASKRGWTSWLTAATGDKRVKAIAPLVIEVSNIARQMPNQFESFGGKFSSMIHDYEERKLLPLSDTESGRKLWTMVDPYSYRDMLTLPKMIINGANDPYWATDSLNLYWDGLKGDKHILYVPNAGHDLRKQEKPNEIGSRKDIFPTQSIDTLAAFSKHIIHGKPMPKLSWKHGDTSDGAELLITSDPPAKATRLHVAESASRDFRKSRWSTVEPTTVSLPASGNKALYGECEYEIDGLKYTLSTQIRVLGPKAK